MGGTVIQRSTVFCLAIAAVGGAALFFITSEAQQREEELARLNRAIVAHQEAIHVLRAEWSYLNQPDRLSALASQHLGLAPMPASRIVRLEDLPVRQAAPEEGAPLVAADEPQPMAKVRPASVRLKPGPVRPAITPTTIAARGTTGGARIR
jgi:hypothetical protein